MLKKILLGLVGLAIVLVLGLAVTYVATGPERLDATAPSAQWLESGPHAVGQIDTVFIDRSRPTQANKDYPGEELRRLVTTLWYPEGLDGNHPLVVYSHGFMSTRSGGSYLAEHLASHGYVVVSADFPLTNINAPGGPYVADVEAQPGDVRFLIDSVLDLAGDTKPFAGEIDTSRIGAMGLSLGGMTTTLVTYHPELRDPRIQAAISIAGPTSMFTPQFFTNSAVPFLMIAGTADGIVPYGPNAADVPTRVAQGLLVSIEGGSHVSFASVAEPAMRFVDNPDNLGCEGILGAVDIEENPGNPFPEFGGAQAGVVYDPDVEPPCAVNPLPKSIHPGRQHMITTIAVRSFFDSVFVASESDRMAAKTQLMSHLATDFDEVSFSM